MAKILVVTNCEQPNSTESFEVFKSIFHDFHFGANVWDERKIGFDAFENIDYFDCILIFHDVIDRAITFYKNSRADKLKIPLLLCVTSDNIDKISEYNNYDLIFKGATNFELNYRINDLINNRNLKNSDENHGKIDGPFFEKNPSIDSSVIVGNLRYNESRFGFLIKDEPIDFTFKEFEILNFLIESSGKFFKREEIFENLWKTDASNSRVIDVHIRRIRSKLGPQYSQFLKSSRSVGYCWVSSQSN